MNPKESPHILFVLSLLFIVYMLTINAVHFSNIDYTAADVDIVFNHSANVSAWGTNLTSNQYVCSGLITVNASHSGFYENLTGAVVPCPVGGCSPRYYTIPTVPPFALMFINQTGYNNLVATYPFPIRLGPLHPPATPLAPYNSSGQYYALDENDNQENIGAPAIFSHGLLCYGADQILVNGTVRASSQLDAGGMISYNLTSGFSNVSYNLSVERCGMYVRTFMTDGNTKDAFYTSPYLYSSPINLVENISVVNGPSFAVVSPPATIYAINGSPFIFSFSLQNIGDLNATITALNMTDNFTVNSFAPAPINANQTVIMTVNATAPAVIGFYFPNLTISYVTTTPGVLGTCGNGTQTNVPLGQTNTTGNTSCCAPPINTSCCIPPVIVTNETAPALSTWIRVNPSGILLSDGSYYPSANVLFNASIARNWDLGFMWSMTDSNMDISIYNMTSAGVDDRLIHSYKSGETSWNYYTENRNGSNVVVGQYLKPLLQHPVSGGPAVYHAVLSVYDNLRNETVRTSTYFTVYSLSCVERA